MLISAEERTDDECKRNVRVLTLKVRSDAGDPLWSSGKTNYLFIYYAWTRGSFGGEPSEFFKQLYLPECFQIVCRNLDSVGKQTWSGFTLLESGSTHRE